VSFPVNGAHSKIDGAESEAAGISCRPSRGASVGDCTHILGIDRLKHESCGEYSAGCSHLDAHASRLTFAEVGGGRPHPVPKINYVSRQFSSSPFHNTMQQAPAMKFQLEQERFAKSMPRSPGRAQSSGSGGGQQPFDREVYSYGLDVAGVRLPYNFRCRPRREHFVESPVFLLIRPMPYWRRIPDLKDPDLYVQGGCRTSFSRNCAMRIRSYWNPEVERRDSGR